MRTRSGFVQGLIAGIAAGVGIAALLRSGMGRCAQASTHRPYEWDSEYSQGRGKPALHQQREGAGGNPANLAPEKATYASTSFERPSGAPGSPSGAERINVPGRPGETADLSDPAQTVLPATRTVPVDKSKNKPARSEP